MNDPYYLSVGAHSDPSDGRCAMEWVSWIAGEPHTVAPVCVDVALQAFCIGFNDALGDADRQKLRPYLARCVGTAGDGRTTARGYMCLDWLVRTYTPAWLELAALADDAQRLRALSPIVDLDAAKAAELVISTAGDAAWGAAGDAAKDAAWGAARDAAKDAAWGAARVAAWAAARDAAKDAAWDAAWGAVGAAAQAAARGAAVTALAPTVKMLQASAFDLLDRMLPTVMIDLPAVQASRAREVCALG